MGKKPLSQTEFKNIYSKVPRLCVDLVIKSNKGIVLSKRSISPDKGKWHLPGGTVFFNEKLSKAIKRIAKEETYLSLEIEKTIGTVEYLRPKIPCHAVSMVFLTKVISGKLKGSWQGKEIKYFKELPPNTLEEHARLLIEKKLLH